MGRAPSSGSCHTCRRRRIKCDQGRPACEKCVRASLVCGGYEPVLRIQNHAAVGGRLKKIQNMTSYPSEVGTEARRRGGRGETKAKADRQERRTVPIDFNTLPSRATEVLLPPPSQAQPPPPPLIPQPDLSGFVDDMALSYFFQAYGWINMHSLLLQDTAMQTRLLSSSTENTQDSLTADSLRALCWGLLGRDKGVPALQAQARRRYGRAIGMLREAIESSSSSFPRSTSSHSPSSFPHSTSFPRSTSSHSPSHSPALLVKPIALLGAYSMTVEQDLRFTHHAGLAQILEFCGPAAFRSPDLLPVFESVRWTLVADAVVRRQATFLEHPLWQTVPWTFLHKSPTQDLIDILAVVPGIIQGVWAVLTARFDFLLGGKAVLDDSSAVASLQQRVEAVCRRAAVWRRAWEALYPDETPRLLRWALDRARDDVYRPGIGGVQGPDVFTTSVQDALTCSVDADDDFFDPVLLRDAAVYTTVLVWTNRLHKYLAGAAASPTAVDFMSTPFYTSCDCCAHVPPLVCETSPPFSASAPPIAIDPTILWNVGSCRMAVSPIHLHDPAQDEGLYSDFLSVPLSSDPLSSFPSVPSLPSSSLPPSSLSLSSLTSSLSHPLLPSPIVPPPDNPLSPSQTLSPPLLLPGDVRFAAHLRILRWLCRRLPATRSSVLAVLAAIGLAHCAHDVRPIDGLTEVAAAASVARVLDETGVDGAMDVLLRSYKPRDG